MDLAKFVSLLSSKSIWLACSDTFKDKREGIFNSAMRQELVEIYQRIHLMENVSETALVKNVDNFQAHLVRNMFLSCWHKSLEENMVMWEVYGQTHVVGYIKGKSAISIARNFKGKQRNFTGEGILGERLFCLDRWP